MLRVMHRQMPDRVPVMPGFGSWYASRIFGGDVFDVEEGRLEPGKMAAELTRKYGCEMWYWDCYGDDIPEVWSNRQIVDQTVTKEVLDDDNYISTHTTTTPSGTVSATIHHGRINQPHAMAGLIKDPERDWPVVRDSWGNEWKWGDRTSLSDVPPEDLELGVTSFAYALPVDTWVGLRCDTGSAIVDLYDDLPCLGEAFGIHESMSVQKLEARLKIDPLPDMVILGGSSSSLSVISPDIYRRYNLDYINKITDLAHTKGVPVMIHHCGRSRALVDIVANETNVDIQHPLEPPPGGDCDLAEVKRKYGRRLVLNGNLNTFHLMLKGTPAQVKEAARKAIEDAAEGGMFILCTGDQLGRDTPEENIMAMVEAAHEYGVY